MKVKTADGTWLDGESAADLVKQMHESAAFARSSSDRAWMQLTAERALTQSGHQIRTSSAEQFLADLAKHGLVELQQ